MRNQRALAAACAAVAALGLATPVAVADGMGNGNGQSGNGVVTVPGGGNVGPGGGAVVIPGNGYPNGNFPGNGFPNGGNGLGNNNGNNFGPGGGNNFGPGGGNGFGRGGGNGPRDIIATPNVVAAGGRLSVTVEGCRGGTATSTAFGTIRLAPVRDDTSRGVARISRDTAPGRYDIAVDCDNRRLIRPGAFTVLGAVAGGLGGSTTSGATPADLAIGGTLVGSALIGGGAYWLRRRQENRV
ncbi:hypothetical protein KUM39_18180 [Streptomyces sp. J2-1]|uniref:hypothetical protein n=1 Tax=Streptomyces corallincola TaxID=2851888 RepID=UPI001C38546E|nr:hypothetical protein [Streptomyces corallincola]MBV2356282.1 hypothetical protein [Streptomyces corallincola]